jgi:hypothetical protein
MNGMRKIFALIVATLTLAAFALSSGAAFGADKQYTLTMSPLTGTSPIAAMTATFVNKGNSSFNSLTLTVPANYALTGTPTTSRGDISYSGGVITILNINLPTGSGQTLTVTMSGVTTSGACGAGVNGNWTAVLWTGSSLTGNNFAQVNPSKTQTSISPLCYTVTSSTSGNGTISPLGTVQVAANATTAFTLTPAATYYIAPVTGTCGGTLSGNTFTTAAVTANCTVIANFAQKTLTITSAPTSAVAGTPFNVTVGENPGGPTPSMSSSCATSTTGATSPTSTTFSVTIPNLGNCTMTFSVPGYTSAALTLKAYMGTLACGDYDSINGPSDAAYDPDLASSLAGLGSSYVGTPGWGLRRGPNRDGSLPCIKVNYTCNFDEINNVASCTFDKASGQLATFKYLFLWTPKPPDANGWNSYRPQVSWNIATPDNTFALPDWVPLLACINDTFPALPTLPTTILPVIPFVSPFTDPANAPPPPATNTGHPWYQPGVTALVCGAQQGWTAVGTPPNALIQTWNILIDEEDMGVKGP